MLLVDLREVQGIPDRILDVVRELLEEALLISSRALCFPLLVAQVEERHALTQLHAADPIAIRPHILDQRTLKCCDSSC
jgi:hypothetical protein